MAGENNSNNVLKFLELVGNLKDLPRQGWVLTNIRNPECVASHMYRMAILTFFLESNPCIDKVKCMKMALVHDLPECLVGDITPHCGIDPVEKHRRELEAMQSLRNMAGFVGNELFELYKEYADQTSAEAKLVKQLDRFDMILQAFEYEKSERKPRLLQQFFESAGDTFSDPVVKSLVEQLKIERSKFENKSTVNP